MPRKLNTVSPKSCLQISLESYGFYVCAFLRINVLFLHMFNNCRLITYYALRMLCFYTVKYVFWSVDTTLIQCMPCDVLCHLCSMLFETITWLCNIYVGCSVPEWCCWCWIKNAILIQGLFWSKQWFSWFCILNKSMKIIVLYLKSK